MQLAGPKQRAAEHVPGALDEFKDTGSEARGLHQDELLFSGGALGCGPRNPLANRGVLACSKSWGSPINMADAEQVPEAR